MRSRAISFLLAVSMLLSCVPIYVSATETGIVAQEEETESCGTEVVNSDVETYESDWYYYVDLAGGSFVYRETVDFKNKQYLTDFPVEQIAILDESLFMSVGNVVYQLNVKTGETTELLKVRTRILRFALAGNTLYYLTIGELQRLDLKTSNIETVITEDRLSRFWLEDAATIAYMVDDTYIYYFDMHSSSVTMEDNPASSLEDTIMESSNSSGKKGLTASSLRSKFPHGKYWNHMPNRGTGSTYNNQDGWTSQACYPHNGYCGTSMQTCNGFMPSNKELSWQCMGYAEKCGYDVTGYNPRNNANGWYTYTSSSALDNLKAGDIVRYKNDGHSIFVISVSGDTVTYTDCNSDNHCVIRWDATISKSTLRSTFTHLRSSPVMLSNSVNLGENFYAFIIKEETWKHLEATSYGEIQIASNGNDSYDPKQIWNFVRQGDGSYKIINEFSQLCLDADNWGTENGTKVGVMGDNGTSAQRWLIFGCGNAYSISPAYCTDISLDVKNNSNEPGTEVQLYQSNGTGAQIFSIYNLTIDGVDYVKPARPSAPNVVAVEYINGCTANISWNESSVIGEFDERIYDLRIYKGPTASGDYYYSKFGISDNHHTLDLPKGTYTISVAAVNSRYYEWYTFGEDYTVNADPCGKGHSYTYKATTNPTTSATGILTGTCDTCSGTTTITLPKLNITDYTKTTTKAATCTATGTDSYKWKTTTYGMFTFTATTAAKGHTPVTDKAVAATCTAEGKTEGSHCSVCNAVIKAQTAVAALGHNYTSKVTAPTCTAQGYTTYTCSSCSHSYKDNYTNATNHSYTYKATKNPTTSATGTLTGTCSKCSGTTTVTLPKLNTTDYTKTTTKAATCTATGTDSYKWKTTTYGTFTFTATTPAKGHTAVTDKAVAATCTAEGKTEGSHCSVCNAVIKAQTAVAALGHSYTSKVTAPTCTAQGYTTYTCSRCSHSYKDNYTNATNHSYTYKATKNPTTSATGTLTGTCSKCSGTTTVTLPKLNTTDYTKTTTKAATCTATGTDSYQWNTTTYGTFTFTETTPAKGHTPVTDKAVAATCTAEGKTEGSHCSVCNAVIKAQTTVAALGHSYTSKVTAPTCTAQGYTTYTCSRCSHSYKDSYINATGHSYTYTDKGDTHEAVCGACGHSVTETHSYVDNICVCGAEEIFAPITDSAIVINHSLNLASDISINYAVKADLLTAYDSFRLEVQVPIYNGNALTGFKTVSVDPVCNGSYYYFTMSDITAVNMNDTLVATLHMTKGNQEYVSKPDSYSIVTYALNQLNKTSAAKKMKVLCADLLRYGAAAQKYKRYRTDAEATMAMTDAHKALLSDLNAVTFGNTNTVYNDLTNPMITWEGKILSLDSKVVVKFVFNAGAYTGNISNLTLRMVYQDNSGLYQTVTLSNPEVYNEGKRQYAFAFDGLMAAELRTAMSVAVYSGETQLSQTLQYSIDTYGSNKTGVLGELCKALFAYSDSAKAYFS